MCQPSKGYRTGGPAVCLQDGLTGWKRYPQPVLVASKERGAWDCGAVGTPCAVSMKEGRWRLYYAGRGARCGAEHAAGSFCRSPHQCMALCMPCALQQRALPESFQMPS